jgi:hypothetical protein
MMVGVAPKSYLHEMFADHEDAPSCSDTYTDGPCIHKQGLNCAQAEIVVPASYDALRNEYTRFEREFVLIPLILDPASLVQLHFSTETGRSPPAHV